MKGRVPPLTHLLFLCKDLTWALPVSAGHPGVEECPLIPLLAAATAAAGRGGEVGDPESQQQAEPHPHPVHAAALVYGDRRS